MDNGVLLLTLPYDKYEPVRGSTDRRQYRRIDARYRITLSTLPRLRDRALTRIETYRVSTLWYSALCVGRLPRELIRTFLRRPGDLRRGDRIGTLTDSFLVTPPGGGSRLFVKLHRRSAAKALADCLARRASRARRGFEIGLALERARVSAVRPLACMERRLPGLSYLLLDSVDGPDLHSYLVEKLPEIPGEAEREQLKNRLWYVLADTLAHMHAARVRQRDLKAPNVIVRSVGSEPRTVLVDLEGMQLLQTLPTVKQRTRDLGRLAVSLRAPLLREAGVKPSDWELLLQLYLEACRSTFPSSGDLRDWLDTTLTWAAKKEAPILRSGGQVY